MSETIQERWARKGLIPKPLAPTSTAAPVTTGAVSDLGAFRERAWVQAKLDAKCAEISAMPPESGRNNALNAAAYSVGHYVPTFLGYQDAYDHLYTAAIECGCEGAAATLKSGLEAGMKEPRRPTLADDPLRADPVFGAMPSREQVQHVGEVDPSTGEVVEPLDDRTPEQIAEAVHANQVRHELALLRIRHDAKIAHAAELAAKNFRVPPSVLTLTEELAIPPEPVKYHIEELLPAGGNALLTAGFKTGKTTMVGDYLRAFADGKPFLGKFDVSPAGGRVAIFNYELSPSLYREWLRELGIINTDKISVLHLRGYRMPIIAPAVEDWIVAWLAEREITSWIPDPFARAAVGTDENSNTEVGVWTDTIDVIKQRAGVRDLILPNHTGRAEQESGQERGRGATRLDDWADVRWILTKDDQDDRYFRATGRDVDLGEERLTYTEADRSLTFGGGDRAWTRRRRLEDAVMDFVRLNPGATGREIEAGVGGKRDAVSSARQAAVKHHRLRIENGPKNAQLHYSNEV